MQGKRIFGLATPLFVLVATLSYAPASLALIYEWDFLGGVRATINTSIGLGAQWRLSERNEQIIGYANLNPKLCRSLCQPTLSTPRAGLIQLDVDGDYVNNLALNAPGVSSINFDNGTLNYDQYEMTQGVVQIGQDINLEFKNNFGFILNPEIFIRWHFFHDFVNYDREIYYPNFYLPGDRARDLAQVQNGIYGTPTVGSEVLRDPPDQDRWNELVGQDFDLLAGFFQFDLPTRGLFGSNIGDLRVTIGEQTINWGESTLFVLKSLNTINPANVNALFRPAFLSLATVFKPVGAIKIQLPLTYNTSFTAFYQYDWDPVEIPPSGAFLSFVDVTLGADNQNLNPGLGQSPDDPLGLMRAETTLLTAVSRVDGQVPIHETHPSDGGQFGLGFTWYLPRFNNGTEFRFFYVNLHSRLPYLSAYAGKESCYQSAPTGDIATDTLNLIADCPNADFAHFLGPIAGDLSNPTVAALVQGLGQALNNLNLDATATRPNGQPCPTNVPVGGGPCGAAYRLDTFETLLEYPEDIHMFGISFNTSFDDVSIQGEIAYRPNQPLQIEFIDVAFAALQPSAPVGCADGVFTDNQAADCTPASFDDRFAVGLPIAALGALANAGSATGAIGNVLNSALGIPNPTAGLVEAASALGAALQGLNLAPLQGLGLNDEVLADPPGRRNAFPDYLTEYRGRSPGHVAPGEYLRGYERFQVLHYILGGTKIIGPGNWLFSDQIIILFEVGATQVLGFPDRDELQIEGVATFDHASVGGDGTGAPPCPPGTGTPTQGFVQGNSNVERGNTTWCGPYQLRFNNTQQTTGFATAFSWGYNVVAIIRYENVLPGVTIKEQIIWQHDINGIEPGPGQSVVGFVEGQMSLSANTAFRVGSHWTYIVGFTLFFGNETHNYYADRDFFQMGIEYRF